MITRLQSRQSSLIYKLQAILMFAIKQYKRVSEKFAICRWTNLSIIHCFVGLSCSTFCSCRPHYLTNLKITGQINIMSINSSNNNYIQGCPLPSLNLCYKSKCDNGYPPVALTFCDVFFLPQLSVPGTIKPIASTITIVTLSHLVSMLFH